MSSVLVVLFWVWLAVSVVVLVRRRVTRSSTTGTDSAAEIAADDADDVADDPVASFFANSAAAAAGEPPLSGDGPDRQPVGVGAPGTPPPGLEPRAVPTERRGPRTPPAAGIAEALMGISMPCDLVPLVVDRLARNKVTLSTTGYPAEVVGTSLADEIERLGYVLTPVSDRELVATRGGTRLLLTITPPGADGRHLDHPTARDDAVVVEIALG